MRADMGARRFLRWRTIGFAALVGAALGLAAMAAVAMSGVYNVAASSGHWIVTDRLIRFAVRRSVILYSLSIDVPDLSREGLVRLGAAHFELACAACHGSPSKDPSQIVHGMLPKPPSLSGVANDWKPEQLFWIIRNGLKLTGMPAWSDLRRDDEVWAVVAFLQHLPGMDPDKYPALAGATADRAAASHLAFGTDFEIAHVCERCHVSDAAPQPTSQVPELRGQSWVYLQRALKEYQKGTRASGIMGPIAAELRPAEIDELARTYARLAGLKEQTGSEALASVQRGRVIAEKGLPRQGIPACLVCHGGVASPHYPRLRGLSEDYVAAQLSVWRRGLRNLTEYGAVMSAIATRLTDEQVRDVSAFFGHLAAPQDARDLGNTP